MSAISRRAPTVARILLGLIFFVFGLAGLFNLMPPPKEPPPPDMQTFFAGIMATKYFMPLLKLVETVAGAMLLSNRFVPLALTLLAPIIVNIVAVHTFLAPSGLPVAIVVLVLEIYLAWSYRDSYRTVLQARALPTGHGDQG